MIVSSLRRLAARPEFFGVLDAGLASLATFGIGLFAARVLDPVELGAYALCFRAVFLAGVVSSHGVFLPSESLAALAEPGERLALMGKSLRLGTPPALLAALAAAGWVVFAPASVSRDAIVALTGTAIAAAFLSPVQDHIRRMLHVGGDSRAAALVSGVQLGAVVVLLGGGTLLHVDRWWLPFGALAAAKLVSTLVGLVRSKLELARLPSTPLLVADVWQLGRWLMLITLLDAGSAFAAVALVATVAGTAAVGYAEAARVAAHPVMVLAWGLSGVLGPRAVRAGRALDADAGRQITRVFVALLGAAGAACLLFFGMPWAGNPMAWLLPVAYVVPGLVAASILAHLALGAPYMARSELIGGQLGAAMAKVDLVAALLRVMVAGLAGVLHAHAVPASLFASGVAQWVGYRRRLRSLYLAGRRTDAFPVEAQHAGS